ncbi:MAG TPA: MarR family transcriptional regulator [Thermoplasmatales archaeon]|nr:MarR family transcriptional regulator [Thermoplasmatales archaeon]
MHHRKIGGKTHNESIGRLISHLHRHIHMYIDRRLERYGIGSGQFPFLMRLYRNDGVNQETLARFLDVDKATSARAIKKLEDAGYVRRERDAEDSRAYRIFLTEKGKSVKPAIKNISRELREVALSGFTGKEKDLIILLLERMIRNISSTEEGK